MAVLKKDNVGEFLQNLLASDDLPTDIDQLCLNLNLCLSLDSEVVPLVGEVLAALSREESFREQAGLNDVLSTILPFLSAPDVSTRLQILRAIGNLCIDNDANREIVRKAGGCASLTEQVRRCCDSSSEEFDNERFKCVVCGCILNVAANNEQLAHEFVAQGAHEEVSLLLNIVDQSENVLRFGLQALCVLTDGELEAAKTSCMLKAIIHLIACANKEGFDWLKLVLELAKLVIEKGETLALQLTRLGIVEQIMGVGQDFQQQAWDLLTLLLGKDTCMQVIFEDNKTLLLMKTWLEAPTQLQVATAALAVANMARSDSNCNLLVKDGFVPLLMAVMEQKETELMTGKLHHAALSALRNLSIPAEHKEKLFSMGVVDCAIDVLKTSTFSHVQFKAVGILRLLVENQAPTCLYVVKESMSTLNRVCSGSGISHVHIEIGRLLAAVVKYCKDGINYCTGCANCKLLVQQIHSQRLTTGVIVQLTSEGGLKWIYHLMQSEQPQLVAEGLIAINIVLLLHPESLALLNCEASSSIVSCMCSSLTSPLLNLINNSLVLTKTLLSTESEMKSLLKNSEEIKQILHNHLSHENEEIKQKTKEILELFFEK